MNSKLEFNAIIILVVLLGSAPTANYATAQVADICTEIDDEKFQELIGLENETIELQAQADSAQEDANATWAALVDAFENDPQSEQIIDLLNEFEETQNYANNAQKIADEKQDSLQAEIETSCSEEPMQLPETNLEPCPQIECGTEPEPEPEPEPEIVEITEPEADTNSPEVIELLSIANGKIDNIHYRYKDPEVSEKFHDIYLKGDKITKIDPVIFH